MAHWFHRNPLKSTAPVGFELRQVISGGAASKIASDIRLSRTRLLDLLTDASNEVTAIDEETVTYLSLLQGFLMSFDQQEGDSKLRRLIRFKWTNSLLGFTPTELNDAYFEALSMLFNVALWYTKHAALLAGRDEVAENEAKEVHRCLRKAAGMFSFILREKGRLNEEAESGSDLDSRVIGAYINQCTAEAQEITVARAIELKHNASLVSALAKETADLFHKADENLQSLDQTKFEKWRMYLLLKYHFYLAYAYSYRGELLLAEDKCGEAIKALQESLKSYETSEKICAQYAKAKGAGSTVKPEKHLFFRRLKPYLDRTLDKCTRENGFIYHQKVPIEVPELETKATYGLVKPEDFALPSPNAAWTAQTYASFDITKAPMPDFSKAKKGDKELPAVKEAPVYQTDKDPKNSSGCVIS